MMFALLLAIVGFIILVGFVIIGVGAFIALTRQKQHSDTREALHAELGSRGQRLLQEHPVTEVASVGVPLGWGKGAASVWSLDDSLILRIGLHVIQLQLHATAPIHPASKELAGDLFRSAPLERWTTTPEGLTLQYRHRLKMVSLRFAGTVDELQPLLAALPESLRG